jgi:hypothetical protein
LFTSGCDPAHRIRAATIAAEKLRIVMPNQNLRRHISSRPLYNLTLVDFPQTETTMKKLLALTALGVLVGGATLIGSPTEANAWGCRATSPSAWGQSSGYRYRSEAVNRALRECAVRTPRYETCYIRSCWRD